MKHLKIGHAAPEFCSKDQDGNPKEGELTIILTPSGAGANKNAFAKPSEGVNNEYTF